MKIYEIPELKIEIFMTEDILTTSGGGEQSGKSSAVDKAKAASNYGGGTFVILTS